MDAGTFSERLLRAQRRHSASLPLEQGARVAVIGGGPAGSFFSYFLLDMAERTGHEIHVDLYEPRDFSKPAPAGCNMCGGVIYESLVQSLAVDGINLPETVVQRGIEYNKVHLDTGSACIRTPRREKRIATTFRGIGPRGLMDFSRQGLDGYLLDLAVKKGARHIRARVEDVRRPESSEPEGSQKGPVQVKVPGGEFRDYELVAVTTGVNTAILKLFREMGFGYEPPRTAKLACREYYLGEQDVSGYLGPAFHAFMLDIPGLDYGAIIPKGDYMTVCLLSSHGDLRPESMKTFLDHPAVRSVLPPDFSADRFACWCGPRINISGSRQPYGDRMVFIGDSGVSRLYKDGIGAAYRAAKAAARTAIFQGVSARDFERHYLPFCRKMEADNRLGKWLFKFIGRAHKFKVVRRTVLRMVTDEQQGAASAEHGMSMVMWDMLTGGTPYKNVLRRLLKPAFLLRFLREAAVCLLRRDEENQAEEPVFELKQDEVEDESQTPMEYEGMTSSALGRIYQDGEAIFRKGDMADSLFVIQEGQVEVLGELGDHEVRLALIGAGEVIGEMAIFERQARSATVRALGKARVLTVDDKTFLRLIHQDPSLGYQLLKMMSNRLRKLDMEVTHLRVSQCSDGEEVQSPPAQTACLT